MPITIQCVRAHGNTEIAQYDQELDDTVESVQVLLAVELGVDVDQLELTLRQGADTAGKSLAAESERTWGELGVGDGDTAIVEVTTIGEEVDTKADATATETAKEETKENTTTTTTTTADPDAQRILELFGPPPAAPAAPNTTTVYNEDEMQKKLYEKIQQRNIDENLMAALEYNPELFGTINLLFIKVFINGEPVSALVDTGAMVTVMTKETAERCGMMRLVDTRSKTRLAGVGTSTTIGRIYVAPVVLEGLHIPCSFHVLESNHIPAIFGLDSLRRHRMIVDLDRFCLRLEEKEINFLSESEIRKMFPEEPPSTEEEGEKKKEEEKEKQGEKHTETTVVADTDKRLKTESDDKDTLTAEQNEKVEQFISITGADRTDAIVFLEMALWDVAQAVSIMME